MTGDDFREQIGRAAHEAARAELVRQGWADHPLEPHDGRRVMFCPDGTIRPACGFTVIQHSPDMASWASLPEDRRAFFRAVGMAVYRLGMIDGFGAGASNV